MISNAAARRVMLLVLVVAFAVQFYGLGTRTWHGDELGSIAEALAPGKNANSLPYFLLLGSWLNAGVNEFWVRSLSALAAVLAVALTFAWARAVSGRRIALVTALLLATNPFLAVYGQQVRFYTLALAGAIACMLAFSAYLKRTTPGRLILWLGAAAAAVAALLLNGLLVVAQALCLFILSRRWSNARKAVLAGAALAVVALVIAVPELRAAGFDAMASYTNAAARYSESRGLGISQVAKVPLTFFFMSFGESVYPLAWWLVVPGAVVFAILFVLGLAALRPRRSLFAFIVVTLVSAPVLMFLVLDPLAQVGLQGAAPRYLIFLLPVFCLVLAHGAQKRMGNWLLVPALAVNLLSLGQFYYGDWAYTDDRVDWHEVTRFVAGHATPDTLVLVDGRASGNAGYYFPGDWKQQNNWGYVEAPARVAELGERSRLIWVSGDYRQAMRKVYSELLGRIEERFALSDAWVRYPVFVMVYDRKNDAEGNAVDPRTGQIDTPAELYGLEFQDVKLPIQVEGEAGELSLRGAFSVDAGSPARTLEIRNATPARTIRLVSTVTNAGGVPVGAPIALLAVTYADGRQQTKPLRLGTEVAAWNGSCEANGCRPVVNWLKRAALAGTERYPESWQAFQAFIFQSDISLASDTTVREIRFEPAGGRGTLYIWGLALAR